jgi:hypothetical protein
MGLKRLIKKQISIIFTVKHQQRDVYSKMVILAAFLYKVEIVWDLKFSRQRVWCPSSGMDALRSSETSFDNHFTWQYIPEDNSEQQGGNYLWFYDTSRILISKTYLCFLKGGLSCNRA